MSTETQCPFCGEPIIKALTENDQGHQHAIALDVNATVYLRIDHEFAVEHHDKNVYAEHSYICKVLAAAKHNQAKRNRVGSPADTSTRESRRQVAGTATAKPSAGDADVFDMDEGWE